MGSILGFGGVVIASLLRRMRMGVIFFGEGEFCAETLSAITLRARDRAGYGIFSGVLFCLVVFSWYQLDTPV